MVAANHDTCILIGIRDSLQDSFMLRTALYKVARTFLADARRCHPCFHSPSSMSASSSARGVAPRANSSQAGARSSLRPQAVTCHRPPPADKQGRVHRTGLAVSMRPKQGCLRCAAYWQPFLRAWLTASPSDPDTSLAPDVMQIALHRATAPAAAGTGHL